VGDCLVTVNALCFF